MPLYELVLMYYHESNQMESRYKYDCKSIQGEEVDIIIGYEILSAVDAAIVSRIVECVDWAEAVTNNDMVIVMGTVANPLGNPPGILPWIPQGFPPGIFY